MLSLFTTVADGNLALHVGDDPHQVQINRAALAQRLKLAPDALRWMKQVHGNHVQLAAANPPEADGVIAIGPGVAVAVLVADCVPLLLSDSANGVIAAVHVGRRGLANKVAVNAVTLMKEHGANQIEATLGPAICGACYEVPLEMQTEIVAIAPAAKSQTSYGTAGLDIRAGLAEQLLALGVTSQIDPRCTREDADFFSYRRDPHCGRFAGVIMVS